MNRLVTTYLILLAVTLAVWALTRAVRRNPLGDGPVMVATFLEVGVVVQAVVDGAILLAGHRPRELPVHVAYLLVSVGLLPLLLGRRERWTPLLLAFACVAVAVVPQRMWVTWPG